MLIGYSKNLISMDDDELLIPWIARDAHSLPIHSSPKRPTPAQKLRPTSEWYYPSRPQWSRVGRMENSQGSIGSMAMTQIPFFLGVPILYVYLLAYFWGYVRGCTPKIWLYYSTYICWILESPLKGWPGGFSVLGKSPNHPVVMAMTTSVDSPWLTYVLTTEDPSFSETR